MVGERQHELWAHELAILPSSFSKETVNKPGEYKITEDDASIFSANTRFIRSIPWQQ
jgi:hypothetical protein